MRSVARSRSVPASYRTALTDSGAPASASAAVRRQSPTGCTPRSNSAPPPQSGVSDDRQVGGACTARADRCVRVPSDPTRVNSTSTTGDAARCSEYSTGRRDARFGVDDPVGLGQRAGNGRLDDDLIAGVEQPHDIVGVSRRGSGDDRQISDR